MTPDQLFEIEARLRAAMTPASGRLREFLENSPADIAALIAAYKDATRERDKVRMLFESKDASLVAIARERDEARAQLEAVAMERDGLRDDLTVATAERSIVDGADGKRLALEVAALTKINQRQVALVHAAEAKAEEQRLSSDAGWERVHKLEDERDGYKAALVRLSASCRCACCEYGAGVAREALKETK